MRGPSARSSPRRAAWRLSGRGRGAGGLPWRARVAVHGPWTLGVGLELLGRLNGCRCRLMCGLMHAGLHLASLACLCNVAMNGSPTRSPPQSGIRSNLCTPIFTCQGSRSPKPCRPGAGQRPPCGAPAALPAPWPRGRSARQQQVRARRAGRLGFRSGSGGGGEQAAAAASGGAAARACALSH